MANILELMKKMAEDSNPQAPESDGTTPAELKNDATQLESAVDELVQDINTVIQDTGVTDQSLTTESSDQSEKGETAKEAALKELSRLMVKLSKLANPGKDTYKLASAVLNDALKPQYQKIAQDAFNRTWQVLERQSALEKQAQMMMLNQLFNPYVR